MAASGKYIYQCPMATCGKEVGSSLPNGPSFFPTCNGEDGSHSRLMDFVESRSKAIPRHITEAGIKLSVKGDKDTGYKTRDGGNWIS